MRTHAEIAAAIGPEKLADLRGVSIHTARSWAQRDGIPAEHWAGITEAGFATLHELAVAAAANPRRRSQQVAA